MSPQEKAKELVWSCDVIIEQRCNQSSREAHRQAAERCALLIVGQVCKNNSMDTANKWYWDQVRLEIEKL